MDCVELLWFVCFLGELGMLYVYLYFLGKLFVLYWFKEWILFCLVSWFEELYLCFILEGLEKGFVDDYLFLVFILEERFLFCLKSGFVDCFVIEGCILCLECGFWGFGDRNVLEGEIEDVLLKRLLFFVVLFEWMEFEEEWYW